MMKKYISLLFLLLLLAACSSDERVIDSSDKTYKLIAVFQDNTGAALMEMPSGNILQENIIPSEAGFSIEDKIDKIAEYREVLYFISGASKKILALKKSDFSFIAVFDFTETAHTPVDMAFPNATDAYVLHADNTVSVLDIYNNMIVTHIPVSGNPTDIATAGNQVFVAEQSENTIAVIDSRTLAVEHRIQTHPAPTFLDITATGELMVLCLGDGRLNAAARTNSMAVYYDPGTRELIQEAPIQVGTIKATDVDPSSLICNETNFGFITSNKAFFRIDTKNRKALKRINNQKYDDVMNNRTKAKLVILQKEESGTTIHDADSKSGTIDKTISAAGKITTVHPY